MCIKDYQKMLMEIKDKVVHKQLKHKNTIIIGDNSSGKSEILREILKDGKKNYYFIDSVNRTFNYEKVSKEDGIIGTHTNVLNRRLEENKFNLQDSFDLYKSGIGAVEAIYFNYQEELKSMLNEFLGIDFDIEKQENEVIGNKNVLKISDSIEKLSSGYQAIIRLFLEMLYFKGSVEGNTEKPIIIIDEINEFLSTQNEERILSYLIEKFSGIEFVVTTHSADVIASTKECNIIALSGNNYECLDGDDFNSVTDVREIFERIYNLDGEEKEQEIEITLRNLFNMKISGIWTEIETEKLAKIDETKLTNSQSLLVKQIKSW